MERSERIRLEQVARRLRHDLKAIESLLKTAHAPRLASRSDIKKRAVDICAAIQKRGGTVSKNELRTIVSKKGMPFASVGALYAARYIENTKSGVRLGRRGRQTENRNGKMKPRRSKKRSARAR